MDYIGDFIVGVAVFIAGAATTAVVGRWRSYRHDIKRPLAIQRLHTDQWVLQNTGRRDLHQVVVVVMHPDKTARDEGFELIPGTHARELGRIPWGSTVDIRWDTESRLRPGKFTRTHWGKAHVSEGNDSIRFEPVKYPGTDGLLINGGTH